MPRIPLYNQGQGPRVGLATGSLSPRASTEAFTAPGRALASFGEAAGQIAFQFGMAEKKAEQDRVYNEELARISAEADELVMNPKSRTVTDFNGEANEFRTKALSGVEARTDLTKSQKTAITTNLGNYIDRKVSVGRAQVFTKQTADREKAASDSLGAMMNDYLKAPPSLREDLMAGMLKHIQTSKDQNLNVGYDEQSLNYELDKREILAESVNESLGLQYHKDQRDRILNGEGKYEKYDAGERSALAAMVGKTVNYLEGGAVAEADAASADLLATIAVNGDTTGVDVLVDTYKSLGQFEKAENLRTAALVGKKTYEFYDPIKLGNPAAVSDALSQAEDNWKNGSQEQRAENYQVYKNLQEAVQERDRRIQEDAVSYIEQVEGRTLSPSERVEMQKTLGLQEFEISPFSKREFQSLQKSLENLDDIEKIEQLQSFFAPYSQTKEMESMALRQAMKNGMTYAQNIALRDPYDPRSADMLNAESRDQASIDNALKAMGVQKQVIATAVTEQLAPWSKSVTGGTTDGYLNRMGSKGRADAVDNVKRSVIKLAEVYVTAGMDMGAAVKAASNLITDKYVFVTGRSGNEIRMPSTLTDKSDDIASFLDRRLMDEEYLENAVHFRQDATDYESDQYIKEVRAEGRWITTTDDTGVYLVDKLGNMVMKRVTVDGVMKEMPIIINFADTVTLLEIEQEIDKTYTTKESRDRRLQELGLK